MNWPSLKIKLPLLVACTALLSIAGCPTADPARHMVWEVQGESNRVFLVGSVHLLREEDYPLPLVFDDVYAAAESIVMELDMDDLDPRAMQQQMMTAALINDGQNLQQLMGEAGWLAAATTAAEMDIDLQVLNAVEPWFAALTVVEMQMVKLGFNSSLGVEFHFLRRAQQDDKTIVGLESVDQQIAFFDQMPLPTQSRFLLKALDDARNMNAEIEQLITAWRHGDLTYMRDELRRGFDGFPQVYQSLVTNRNTAWADYVSDLLDDEEDYLVVVGALHLVGEDSLVSLLSRQGFSLRQL